MKKIKLLIIFNLICTSSFSSVWEDEYKKAVHLVEDSQGRSSLIRADNIFKDIEDEFSRDRGEDLYGLAILGQMKSMFLAR